MPILEILKPGLMTSIQDLGRTGLNYYAIPRSGVMDQQSARLALLVLGLSEDRPVLECTSLAPDILFHDPVQIALSGADFGWTLNGKSVRLNSPTNVQTGDILRGAAARDGLRGYLALKGNWLIEKFYGSHSTYTPASMGRMLQKGDVLEWESIPEQKIPMFSIRKGPEYDFLTTDSRATLIESEYRISIDSNRIGARLEGPVLESSSYQLEHSVPVLPGFIQLPPSGQLIVVLQDGQTVGGYPRIAYIRDEDLGRVCQLGLGEKLMFSLSKG